MNNKFEEQLNAFTTALVTELPVINESVAMNARALIVDRIINEGKTPRGSLGNYSNHELPAFFFNGKSLNSGGDAAIEKAKKEHRGLSYLEFREANSRPTDHVTTSFSGDTWKDVGVVKQVVDGNKIITTVGAKNTKNRSGKSTDDILSYLGERYGDLLEATKEEENKLATTYDVMIQGLIDKTFS